MLSEEGFILVVVGGACVLLILGVLELLWPTKPRHVRQPAPPRQADDVVALPRGFEPVVASRAPMVFSPVPPVSPPSWAAPRSPIATISPVTLLHDEVAPPPEAEPLEAEQPNAAPSEVEPPERLPEPEPLEDAPRAVIAMLIEPPVATPPEVEPLEVEPLPEPEPLPAPLPEPLPSPVTRVRRRASNTICTLFTSASPVLSAR